MAKKKGDKYPGYELLHTMSVHDGFTEIPHDATHVEAEIDYGDCYYESDTPSVKIYFLKKRE